MSGNFEVCPCGTLQRLAAAKARADRAEQCAETEAKRADKAEAERDALLVTLEKIAGFTLSQFMGPHDMAHTCVMVARAASGAARRQR